MRWPRSSLLAVAALLMLCACGDPSLGSQEDLAGQLDALSFPEGITQLGEKYVLECPSSCPSFVRWYDVSLPAESVRAEVTSAMEAAGLSVNQATASDLLFSASTEDHIFFAVLDTTMISGNVNAPPGADLEISVNPLGQP